MKNYLVIVKVANPYPKEYEVSIEASHEGLAVNRAFKKLRKDELKGKRIKEWNIKVITI